MKSIRLTLLLTIMAMVAGACSSASSDSETARVGKTASGGQIDFNSLEGTDAVLWFWAPW